MTMNTNQNEPKRKEPWSKKDKASLVVSIISLILAVISFTTSCYISRKQLKIDENTSKPVINVKHTVNEEKQIIEKIIISNDGDAVENIKINVIPYYEITLSDYLVDGKRTECFLLPIDESFTNDLTTTKYNARNETLAVVEYLSKPESYTQDMTDFSLFAEEEIIDGLYLECISLNCFIRIQYKDLLGTDATEIYKCVLGEDYVYRPNLSVSNQCEISTISENSKMYSLCSDIYDLMYSIADYYEYFYYRCFENPAENYGVFAESIRKIYENDKFKLYSQTEA